MGERRMMQEALFYGFSLERHVPDRHPRAGAALVPEAARGGVLMKGIFCVSETKGFATRVVNYRNHWGMKSGFREIACFHGLTVFLFRALAACALSNKA